MVFTVTMFAVGVVLEPDEVAETVRHPGWVGLGVVTQFSVMPLLRVAAAVPAPTSCHQMTVFWRSVLFSTSTHRRAFRLVRISCYITI